jgi:hypothetical protein
MKLYDHIPDERRNSLFLKKETVEGRFNEECLAGVQQGIEDHADHGEAQLWPIGYNQFKESAIERHICFQ